MKLLLLIAFLIALSLLGIPLTEGLLANCAKAQSNGTAGLFFLLLLLEIVAASVAVNNYIATGEK